MLCPRSRTPPPSERERGAEKLPRSARSGFAAETRGSLRGGACRGREGRVAPRRRALGSPCSAGERVAGTLAACCRSAPARERAVPAVLRYLPATSPAVR